MASDGAETMSAGRSFQTRGATAPTRMSFYSGAVVRNLQSKRFMGGIILGSGQASGLTCKMKIIRDCEIAGSLSAGSSLHPQCSLRNVHHLAPPTTANHLDIRGIVIM